ncbi:MULTISPECIES: maleylpyruvate isomerase family mycothiol-dependent enzyme [Streptomyces]|uniref:maleylpyruvate isomerase family mycothiol-dependent enzyme n=1 Tax=Streptomyces TaxID=1883 RepID=UPI001E4E65D9|nr:MULTISPECIES: maleylpyruvate isomerase family mycothiol-dependent enzyme [Streptomyces]UFQ19761.1 maleylpyruvate isomerase N-terminal domain-containing protein [Streptomyces huasconensis]WCL89381.1 maleylpyruvate isomerase family mycothiol-dependent enzyme [Streptomyces sp. JCM 35825]
MSGRGEVPDGMFPGDPSAPPAVLVTPWFVPTTVRSVVYRGGMTRPNPRAVYDRYVTRISDQSAQLVAALDGADAAAPVPGCPGWTLAHLLRHVAGTHSWAETIVRTRAAEPVPDHEVNDVTPGADDDITTLTARLTRSTARLVETLREAGPDAAVWTPAPGGTPLFWARRMTYETVVHRFDATAAVGGTYTLDPGVALDGLDEWLEFSTLPQAYESQAAHRALLGPGRGVHFHATDAPEGTGEWFIDLSSAPITVSHAHKKAGTAVRGPLTDLLLLLYERRSPTAADGIEVSGDGALFAAWLRGAGHWLRR